MGDAIREQVKTYRDVDVSNNKPTGKARVWVNTASNDTESQDILLPQVDDNNVSEENTWSSKKVDNMFGAFMATRNTAELIEDCYVSSASHKRLEGSNSYHNLADDITLHAGETIYVECTATKDVAVIARKITYDSSIGYEPLVESNDSSYYLYTAKTDMIVCISASYKWDGVYYISNNTNSETELLRRISGIKVVDCSDTIVYDAYISSTGNKNQNTNSYHNLVDDITLHAGETIYVECTATKDVAVIARKYNNNYIPILISEGGDQSVYTFTAPDDMLISISARYKWNNVYCVIPRIKNDYVLDITPSLSMFENFGVVGDSYASGEVAINGYIDYYNVSWGQIIARMCGNKCTNFSAGGLTTRSWLTSPKGKSLLQSSDAQQLYILALGINDYYHLGESYLGTPDDMISKADTFYGNYATIIELIQAKAPNSKIVISTTSSTAAVSSKFNTAIINIANAYKIPCIRQDRDVFFKSNFYCNHMVNGHPVAVVYSAMAKALKRLIETAMMDNLDYFTDFTK